jgi:hypothetical protein
MTDRTASGATDHPGHRTDVLLTAVTDSRAGWLSAALTALRQHGFVTGVWLVGSLGRGDGDPYSDIDLVVAIDTAPPDVLAEPAAALRLPGPLLYTRAKPRNAPAGGAYLAVCVELARLPVLVDLYVWPATTAAVPAGGAVLYQRGDVRRSPLELLALLAEHPAGDQAGADPDDPASLLFLIQLAAKYHARGDQRRRAAIYQQLQLPDQDSTTVLRHLLENQAPHPGLGRAVAAVRRLLDLVDTQPPTRPQPTRLGRATPRGPNNVADP